MRNIHLLLAVFVGLVFILPAEIEAQNVVVTDDEGYTADPSAMLDVKSTSKGLLIPRLSDKAIALMENPATGLLVYNTNYNKFNYYDGDRWQDASAEGLWLVNGDYIYPSSGDARVVIGGTTTNSKFEVRADASFGPTDTLFVVKDASGQPVFAVFPDGARLFVGAGAKGNLGGFAVSGRTPGKTVEEDYLFVTPDSTRVYVNEDAKGNLGGFAVSGRTPGGKTSATSFLNLDPDNYFIGHESGLKINSGLRNASMGYMSAHELTNGNNNILIGYQSGYNNTISSNNVFIGTDAGYNNSIGAGGHFADGDDNIFIGLEAGYLNKTGYQNIAIGSESGYSNNTNYNIFIGFQSGYSNDAIQQVFVGDKAGKETTTGRMNTFVGAASGTRNIAGANNCFVGAISGTLNKHASRNTFIGNQAGYRGDPSDTIHNDNVFLGNMAGASNNGSIGARNIFVGSYSGYRNGSDIGDNNIFIGYFAGNNDTGSDKLIIENNTGATKPLIYGNFNSSNREVEVGGKLGVNTNPIAWLQINAEDGDDPLRAQVNGSTKLYVTSNGGTNIGYYSHVPPVDGLYVHGDLDVNGSMLKGLATEEETAKSSIKGLDALLKLQSVEQTPKDTIPQSVYSFSADIMEAVLPELVKTDADNSKSYDAAALLPVLVKAIQEQQVLIEELQKEVEELKEK